MDERLMVLLRQGRTHFHIGSSGHEAAQVAAALLFEPGRDWALPYYRDLPFVLEWGMAPKEVFLHSFGRADDPCSGGRQMPCHWGHKGLNILTQSSPTGTQFLQAVGVALGMKLRGEEGKVYVSSGEGTTSQGDFYEAVNMASREKLPVFFHIQNNNYAISVPYSSQAAGVDASQMLEGYPNLFRGYVDGTDFFEAFETIRRALEHIVGGRGPALVVSETVRLLAHSSSDDQRKYRSAEELQEDAKRDPLLRFRESCAEMGCVTAEEAKEIEAEVERAIAEAEAAAWDAPAPHSSTARRHLFVEVGEEAVQSPEGVRAGSTDFGGTDSVMVDAINHALVEEMERDSRVLVYGEDVEDGKGGVFGATRGLTQRFGRERVFNSPLAESTILGSAIGLAAYGYRPVVEIQFVDFIWPGFNQLKSELATVHYRSNGAWRVPVVVRTPVGGYIHGGLYHSQSPDAIFTHIPGLKVVYPSNAADAKGLLKAAIRQWDPVIFLEHKGLYRQRFAARVEPSRETILDLGKASVVAAGSDLTVVSWGMQLHKVMQALLKAGLESRVEVIDLRTLVPLDWETISASVKKTGKLLIVHEDTLTGGFGAEIAARAAELLFEHLDGPIRRVAAADVHNPYAAELEEVVLPQVSGIAEAISELLSW